MYFINHDGKDFTISFNGEGLDQFEFRENVDYFKSLYLTWNSSKKTWIISDKKIHEILLWLQKDKQAYTLMEQAKSKLEQMDVLFNKREMQFIRNIKFNKNVLKEGVELYNYQESVIDWLLKRNASLNALDAGLGKSLISISVFSYLHYIDQIDGIIIIVPTGLSYHWQYEILSFTDMFTQDDIQLITNENKIKPFEKYQDKKILIIPSHLIASIIASYRSDYTPKKSLSKIRWNELNVKALWNKKHLMCLVDESHGLKHSDSIKTKAVMSIKYQFDYRMLCSATPAINRIEDFYTQMKFLDYSIIGQEENAFKLTIASSIGNKFNKYAINSYNEHEISKLYEKMKYVMIKMNKEDLPEMKAKRIIEQVYFDLTNDQRELYQLITQEEMEILESEYNKITWRLVLSKLHLICAVMDNPLILQKRTYKNGRINKLLGKWNLEHDPKFISLKDKLENYIEEQGEKVIVYDIHPETLDTLTEKFSKYKPSVIHGQIDTKDKEKDRSDKQHAFNFNADNKVIFLSALTSSQGINLQHGGHRILIYTSPWNSVEFRQIIDRTHRINSKHDSIIEVFCFPNTLDNIRVKRNFNRVELNDRLDKEISLVELKNLLGGIV